MVIQLTLGHFINLSKVSQKNKTEKQQQQQQPTNAASQSNN